MDFNSILESYKTSLFRWTDYQTQADQVEYAIVLIGNILVSTIIGMVVGIVAIPFVVLSAVTGVPLMFLFLPFVILAVLVVGLFLFLAQLAVSVRRLNDMGQSCWWVVLLVLPPTSMIFAIVILFIPGKDGTNIFAPK